MFAPLIYSYIPALGTIRITFLAGVTLIISYVMTKNDYDQPDAYGNPIFLSFIFFLLVMCSGLFVSIDKGLTLSYIKVIIKYFIVMAIMIKIIDNERRLDLLLSVFVACGIFMALSSIYNYASGQTTSHSGYTSSKAIASGIFGDPNDLALLFNSTLPFMLYIWVKAKKKLLPFIGVVCISTAVILTFSRGGFLGLCTLAIAFILLHARKHKKILVYILIIAWGFYVFSPPGYNERIGSIIGWEVDQETGDTGTRMDAWRAVLSKSLAEHPILGAGAGCSIYIAFSSMSDWHLIHSTYIQIISETGLLGFLFYMLLFFLPYRQYRAYAKLENSSSDDDLLRYRMILVSFCSYGATVIFLPQAYSPILTILVGIAIIQQGLITNKQSVNDKAREQIYKEV